MSTCFPAQNQTGAAIKSSPVLSRRLVKSEERRTEDTSPPSAIRLWWQKRLHRYSVKRQQKIDRDAFLTMLSLEDNLLNDIGVTRDEVRWAASLPLSENAAIALRESVGKRTRW